MSVCVCVCGTSMFVCVFSGDIRVVFASNYIGLALFYPRNLLLGHVTTPFLVSVLNELEHEVFNTTAMTSLYLCHPPALVNYIYLIDVLLINLCKHVKAFFP